MNLIMLQAHEKLDLKVQQLKEIKEKIQTLHIDYKSIEIEFERIKAKRHKQFSDCLDFINAEIDSVYKVSIYM